MVFLSLWRQINPFNQLDFKFILQICYINI